MWEELLSDIEKWAVGEEDNCLYSNAVFSDVVIVLLKSSSNTEILAFIQGARH